MADTVELHTRRASLRPQTVNVEERNVEVVWSTGAPVRRRDMAGPYIERLSLAPEAVDLSRLEGASVLDAHRQTAVRDVLGTVRSATVDGKRGTALIQFSARPEVEPVWQDVLAGILRHVSVGYTVEEWSETTENGARVLTAVRWTPHEISLVPTPADPGAHIRMETEMTDTTTREGADKAPTTETRAEANAEIRSIARIAGLDQSWIDGQIDAGADPDTARRAAFEALAKRSAPAIRTEQVRVEIGESQDDPAIRARQMGEALYARINPRHELSEPARRYAYATPVDMAKELLTLRGESTMALSPASLVTRALHTTSDFPIILGDTVGRVLRDAYQAAPSGIRRLGRQTTARDFRSVNKIMLGEAPLLEKLDEHGEIKAGTMAEAREAYKVETWARKIGITRQVLVNDDLGAFADLARRMGQAAAETEARILVTLLEAGNGNGPTMSDGKTLFHADHGNKAGTGAAISDATLSAARLALRTQKGIEDRTIRVTPKHLLVPPALETTAEKWLASIAPATAADVNPFSGSLSLVVEPRLTSPTRWYVTAEPGEIDGLEFAYLSGAEGPQVESRSGWDVDGVEIRVILDFGAGFIDHRGWFMNAGA
ncbi:prohead protease/major capsid protein fusion protein [Paracoccus seriniphilus]|uniref:Mu-like prophage major head subunit gpT n=1 Tax=Paracoccus seriniphilus TaxID=184748 RepID=A0A239PTC1_9RHOB|nr:prohead protease/major capsid protein fusion protein [Paracoccus seriniphilus]WCR14161.1 Mu-like prophage major head subunit gpT family protein [Paracoccus seriniphilus]SNT73156.1 Mu-like prophage major head subunit gpT [Paracoccus seriniphilus]